MKLYYLGKAKIIGYGSMMIPDTVLEEDQLNPEALFKTRKQAEELAEACEITLASNLTPYDEYCIDDLWDIFEIDSDKLVIQQDSEYLKLVK